MPTSDYNGTNFQEFGALGDYDGTTHHPWKKAEDYDGTKWSIIFGGDAEFLYKEGDQAEDITGGWSSITEYSISPVSGDNIPEISTFYPNAGTVAFNSADIKFTYNEDYGGVMIHTNKPINFKELGINSLTIKCTTNIAGWGYFATNWLSKKAYGWWTLGVVSKLEDKKDLDGYYHHEYPDNYINGESTDVKTEIFSKTLTGLTELEGEYYVVVGIYRSVPAKFDMTVESIICGE